MLHEEDEAKGSGDGFGLPDLLGMTFAQDLPGGDPMLHSLPALLDELERRLITGEDPLQLIGSVRWSEVIDWPRNREETLKIRRKLGCISSLINGLQAPLQATLLGLSQNAAYKAKGSMDLPSTISMRLEDCV